MKSIGEWYDLGHKHSMKLLTVDGRVIGGALRHPVANAGTDDPPLCEDGFVQWEQVGSTMRPLFTLESGPGRPVSISPFVVCPICGDKGWIISGKWHPKEDEEGVEQTATVPVLETADEDDYQIAVRRDLGDKVVAEERDADRRLVDMTGRSGDLVLPNDDAVAEAEAQERMRAGFEEGESEGEWAAAPPGEVGPFEEGEYHEGVFVPDGAHEHRPEKTRTTIEQAASPDAPMTVNEMGGKQSDIGTRFDLIDGKAMFAMAAVLDYGAKKYGTDNWRAITIEEHLNHALMHAYAWLSGDRTDDHLSHFLCRAMFAMGIHEQGGPDPSYGAHEPDEEK